MLLLKIDQASFDKTRSQGYKFKGALIVQMKAMAL